MIMSRNKIRSNIKGNPMTDWLLEELLAARQKRVPCALVTIAATSGSVPREAGAKMLVYANGKITGTIGGGKFESLVVEETLRQIRHKKPLLKTWPLRENEPASFGAICGGEVTLLIEPQIISEAIYLIGGGHCSQAIARLAAQTGLHVIILEDRPEILAAFTDAHEKIVHPAPEFIRNRGWLPDEAIIIVSRHYQIDQEALAAALENPGAGYLGMIGSRRKVLRVFDELKMRGISQEKLSTVHAPIGLDIGADSPAEIAISILAEVLQILRGRTGGPLRI